MCDILLRPGVPIIILYGGEKKTNRYKTRSAEREEVTALTLIDNCDKNVPDKNNNIMKPFVTSV